MVKPNLNYKSKTFLLYFFLLQEFVKRYSLLFPRKEVRDVREEIPGILETLKLDPREFQIGKEKVSGC